MRHLALLVAAAFVVMSCKGENPSSRPEAFSASSSGVMMEIEGKINLSLSSEENLARLVGLNLEGRLLNSPGNAELEANWAAFQNPATRVEVLRRETEQLRLNDPVYWITQQLRYPLYINKQKVAISVDEMSIKVRPEGGGRFSYTAALTLISSIPTSEILAVREMVFPLNPVEIYLSATRPEASRPIAETKESGREFLCYAGDGHAAAPYNFYAFFNPYDRPDCMRATREDLLVIERPKLQAMSSKAVYPEFHELFKRPETRVVVAFSKGEEPWGLRNFQGLKAYLERAGYRPRGSVSEFDVTYTRSFSTSRGLRTFTVRTFYRPKDQEVQEIFAQGALGNADLVFFSGHSGFGNNLFQIFNPESRFPKRQYQVFFLLACNSYSYAVSNVLAAKALWDLDFDSYYTDVVATGNAAWFDYFLPVVTTTLRFFEGAALNFGTPGIGAFTYQRLIQEIDGVESDSKRKAVYTVAGEEKNRFQPNLRAQDLMPPASDGRLGTFVIKYLTDPEHSTAEKIDFLRRLLAMGDPSLARLAIAGLEAMEAERLRDFLGVLSWEIDSEAAEASPLPREVVSPLIWEAAARHVGTPLGASILALGAALNGQDPKLEPLFARELERTSPSRAELVSLKRVLRHLPSFSPALERRLLALQRDGVWIWDVFSRLGPINPELLAALRAELRVERQGDRAYSESPDLLKAVASVLRAPSADATRFRSEVLAIFLMKQVAQGEWENFAEFFDTMPRPLVWPPGDIESLEALFKKATARPAQMALLRVFLDSGIHPERYRDRLLARFQQGDAKIRAAMFHEFRAFFLSTPALRNWVVETLRSPIVGSYTFALACELLRSGNPEAMALARARLSEIARAHQDPAVRVLARGVADGENFEQGVFEWE